MQSKLDNYLQLKTEQIIKDKSSDLELAMFCPHCAFVQLDIILAGNLDDCKWTDNEHHCEGCGKLFYFKTNTVFSTYLKKENK